MAERSFAAEVRQLRAEPGTVFHGEGILAVTKALLECGVGMWRVTRARRSRT
jgi:indolepyruvate ferredoxin oxidoreductase alpha subunit